MKTRSTLSRRDRSAVFDLVGSTRVRKLSSGLSTLKKYQIAERCFFKGRRDHREYREYLRKEQRRQPGCPAREVVLVQRGQATRCRRPRRLRTSGSGLLA